MSEEIKNVSGIIPTDTIDARNCPPPIPILKAKKKIAHLKKGSILQIDVDPPGAYNDFSSWCERIGHTYLGQEIKNNFICHYIKI